MCPAYAKDHKQSLKNAEVTLPQDLEFLLHKSGFDRQGIAYEIEKSLEGTCKHD